MAKSCMDICRAKGVPLLINDRVYVALGCDADGFHFGQSDMPDCAARSILGPEKSSSVCPARLRKYPRKHSSMASTTSGVGACTPRTQENNITVRLDGLKAICISTKLPVVVIGNIDLLNAPGAQVAESEGRPCRLCSV